ncbi:MAG: DUF2817 domain-containing protein [Deltaproteobacteria bacterium]|nr:DUF2817 domain-containing protein [Deltaproteobacteria bacterium]
MLLPNIVEYFSSTMPEADAKFRAACRKMGGEATSHRHPLTGPAGEILQTGEFLHGPNDAEKAILFASGMHGIEGYAGAGFQVGVMESGALNDVPDDVAVLFVHMMNPWGCAWDRREDENNVDVARNFIYGDTPAPPNPDYDALNAFLNPTEWTGHVKERADSGLAAYVEQHGSDRVAWAIRNGQHKYPKGMTFHGTEPSWARRTTEAIVKRSLGGAKKILIVDLHTGVGGYGEVTVMSYADAASEKGRRLNNWYGDNVYIAGNDPKVPRHDKMTLDALNSVVPNAEIFSFAIEWGAEPLVEEDFEIFRHLNYLQNYGDLSSEEAIAPRRRSRACFYGETDEWREKAWKNGFEFFNQTLAAAPDWLDI